VTGPAGRGDSLSSRRHPVAGERRLPGAIGRQVRTGCDAGASHRDGIGLAPSTGVSPLAPDDAAILIVDGDSDMRAMLRDVLARAGFRTEEAASTDELFQLVPRVEPAAIILDDELPGRRRPEALPALRRARPRVPVILLTTFGDEGAREAATREGASACLSKPFHLGELFAELARVVGCPEGEAGLSPS
jgi:CheY-like chemotaxis protein